MINGIQRRRTAQVPMENGNAPNGFHSYTFYIFNFTLKDAEGAVPLIAGQA